MGPSLLFLNGTLAQIPLPLLFPASAPSKQAAKLPMQPGHGRFSSCTAAAPAPWHSPALPWLTETHGAAASINGALCSLRSQMPSPSSPRAERVLCVHNQPLGRSELGNKTPSLCPGRDCCPPAGLRAGDSKCEVVCESGQQVQGAGQGRGPKDTCGLIRCALGRATLSLHLGTWDLPSELLSWAPSALQELAEKRRNKLCLIPSPISANHPIRRAPSRAPSAIGDWVFPCLVAKMCPYFAPTKQIREMEQVPWAGLLARRRVNSHPSILCPAVPGDGPVGLGEWKREGRRWRHPGGAGDHQGPPAQAAPKGEGPPG